MALAKAGFALGFELGFGDGSFAATDGAGALATLGFAAALAGATAVFAAALVGFGAGATFRAVAMETPQLKVGGCYDPLGLKATRPVINYQNA